MPIEHPLRPWELEATTAHEVQDEHRTLRLRSTDKPALDSPLSMIILGRFDETPVVRETERDFSHCSRPEKQTGLRTCGHRCTDPIESRRSLGVAAPSLRATHLAEAHATVKPRTERNPETEVLGFEPESITSTADNDLRKSAETGAAESGALSDRFDLDRLAETIAKLTPEDRAKLLAALGAKPVDEPGR
jgi:hypothetical protein